MTQTIDALIQDFNVYMAQFQATAQEKFKEFFSTFWEQNPAIKAIIWTQYTPYFNDGEPCEFSVNDPYYTNAEGEDLDEISYGEYEGDTDGVWSEYSFGGMYDGETPEGVNPESTKQLSKLVCSEVMEPVMKAMFGPDSKVIATREGFRVKDFGGEHD